jgi:hypothetical protein
MMQSILNVSTLGEMAATLLSPAQDLGGTDKATVWGVTSRGVFLHFPPDWIVFLSSQAERGPLTLNVDGDLQTWQSLAPGTIVRVHGGCSSSDGRLLTHNSATVIDFGTATVWQPAPPSVTYLPPQERHTHLQSILQQTLSKRVSESANQQINGAAARRDEGYDQASNLLRKLAEEWRDEGRPHLSTLEAFLGLGPGLTPSGDDLITGLLLALTRWGSVLHPHLDHVTALGQSISRAACGKTNTLSANLIHCASLGQASENLILALDGIMTGQPEPDVCASYLLNWGSTSGCDALMGMALAIDPQMQFRLLPAPAPTHSERP